MTSQPILDSIEILDTKPLSELLSEVTVKVCTVSELPNRNDTVITREVGRDIAATLPGAPVVGYYNQGDFQDHGEQLVWSGRGLETKVLTKPYGFVSLDNPWYQDFLEDGITRTYLMCKAYLWTRQFEEAKQVPGKGQSMELDDFDMDGYWEGNKFIFTHAATSKLCILGDQYEPCFQGAGFLTKYMKQYNDFTSELENILGRRYCVVDGKLTVKEEQNQEPEVQAPATDYTLENTEEKPATTYSEGGEGGTTSGEAGSGEGTGAEGAGETETTEPTEPDTSTDPEKGEGEEEGTDPETPAGEEGDGDGDGEGTGEDDKDPEVTDPETPDDSDDDDPDPEKPEIIGTATVTGTPAGAKAETAKAKKAEAQAEKDKNAFDNALGGVIDEVKPESTTPNVQTSTTEYSLADPDPDQIPDGSTVSPGSQRVQMPSAGEVNVEVKTTGPDLPPAATPETPMVDEAKMRQMVEAAVASIISSTKAAVAEGDFKDQLAGTQAAIDATRDPNGPAPTLAAEAEGQKKDLIIQEKEEQIATLETENANLKEENEQLKKELEEYRQAAAKAAEAKKQALINDYMELIGEEDMKKIADQYTAMNYDDTEKLLSLTYSRKQRENMKKPGGNSFQLNIASIFTEDDNASLPNFMRQAMEIEGQKI